VEVAEEEEEEMVEEAEEAEEDAEEEEDRRQEKEAQFRSIACSHQPSCLGRGDEHARFLLARKVGEAADSERQQVDADQAAAAAHHDQVRLHLVRAAVIQGRAGFASSLV